MAENPDKLAKKVRLAIFVWMVIAVTIAMIISYFLPLIVGFVALNAMLAGSYFWIKRRVIPRLGLPESTKLDQPQAGFMDRLRAVGKTYKYYCASCNFSHDLTQCPKCGSRIKKLRY